MSKLFYSPEAKNDLAGIKQYIAEELENKAAAIHVITRITKRVRELAKFPAIGAPLVSIIDIQTDYRFLVCGNYTAFYRYDGQDVFVDRILYGRRDFMKILFGEPTEQD